MLEWLTRRKTPQEPQQSSDTPVPQSPSPEMEKLRARIQQNLDESDRIRKAQSILQRNPSSEELLTHLHRTDADIRILRNYFRHDLRRQKVRLKLEYMQRKWELKKTRLLFRQEQEFARLTRYGNTDIRLLLLGVSDFRRAKRLLKLRKLLGEIPRSAPGNE